MGASLVHYELDVNVLLLLLTVKLLLFTSHCNTLAQAIATPPPPPPNIIMEGALFYTPTKNEDEIKDQPLTVSASAAFSSRTCLSRLAFFCTAAGHHHVIVMETDRNNRGACNTHTHTHTHTHNLIKEVGNLIRM